MQVDPRGQRFAAVLTPVVLVAVLATGSGALLAVQTLVFALGALLGLRFAPYGLVFRALVQPHITPPEDLEPGSPPRFAQGVGLVFALVGDGWIRVGHPLDRARRHGPRAGGGVPERGVRALPRLRDVPDDPPPATE